MTPDETSPLLSLRDLSVRFGTTPVLQGVSLEVPRGDTLVILGESGCGKTTLLKAIAGLVPIQAGTITLDSQPIHALTPQTRSVIYLDQEPLLFEHLTIAENIGFAMRLRGQPPQEIASSVSEMLAAIDLREHANKREWQLSGGQKQRVAFARAVLAQPQLLLLDEPFCSLDARTRTQMQSLFHQLSRGHSLTSIFVTHDVKEALIVGDQFARMTNGQVALSPDRQAFMLDPQTGVADEIEFWRKSAEQLG